MTEREKKDDTIRRHSKSAMKQETRNTNVRSKKQRMRESGPGEDDVRRRRSRDMNRAAEDGDSPDEWDEDPVRGARSRNESRCRAYAGSSSTDIFEGLVVAVHRDRLIVRVARDEREVLLRRGRPLPLPPAVGDRVICEGGHEEASGGETPLATAVDLIERTSRLSRCDPDNRHRERVLAANVDLAVVVITAAEPAWKPSLIDRYLLALDTGGVLPVVCANKFDLVAPTDDVTLRVIESDLDVYRQMGIPCFETSATTGAGIDALRAKLAGRTVVFSGHSGVGKSALLNRLDSASIRATGAGREFDGKGRHTTTRSQLRELDDGTRLIDTPGIREFGLWAVDPRGLARSFPGISSLAQRCRFADCRHLEEPDCAVREGFPEARLVAYHKLLAEAEAGG